MSDKDPKPPRKTARARLEDNLLLGGGITLKRDKKGLHLVLPRPKPKRIN